MRAILPSLVLLIACGAPTPVVHGTSPAAPQAAAPAEGFFLGTVDPSEIVAWDPRAQVHAVTMRRIGASVTAPVSTSPPVTTSPPVSTTPSATTTVDADNDGYDAHVDCDDSDPLAFPGAVEIVADGVDENCDTVELCYLDADGDGLGGTLTTASFDLSCNHAGMSDVDDDCDDERAAVHPGATEIPGNGLDDDCNSSTSDAIAVSTDTDASADSGGDSDVGGGTDAVADTDVTSGGDAVDDTDLGSVGATVDTDLRATADNGDKGPPKLVGPACGCDAGPRGGALALVVAIPAILTRRRRRTR